MPRKQDLSAQRLRKHIEMETNPLAHAFGLVNEAALQGAAYKAAAGYRLNVLISRAVDHIDRVIAGMCDVEPVRGVMNISVIESATGSMLREFDVAEQTKCHRC